MTPSLPTKRELNKRRKIVFIGVFSRISNKKLSLFMHQSMPAAPSLPRATAGRFARIVSPRGGALAELRCPGVGHLPNPGPPSNIGRARGFLSEHNYTVDFSEKKKKQIGSSLKDVRKL